MALRDIELGEELREDYRGCLRAGWRRITGWLLSISPSARRTIASCSSFSPWRSRVIRPLQRKAVRTSARGDQCVQEHGLREDRGKSARQTRGMNCRADVCGHRDNDRGMIGRSPLDFRGGGKAVKPRHVQIEEDEPWLQLVRHFTPSIPSTATTTYSRSSAAWRAGSGHSCGCPRRSGLRHPKGQPDPRARSSVARFSLSRIANLRWLLNFVERDRKDKGRARSQLTRNADLALHRVSELLANGEAEAGAFGHPRHRAVDLVETLEDPRQRSLRNAWACVN